MSKKANLIITSLLALTLSGCASKAEPRVAYVDMTCTQLIEEIKTTQTAFYRAEREANDYMDIRTGGAVGIGGGSSGGVNIGASVGISKVFSGDKRAQAQLKADDLKSELDILNRVANNKDCL